ncbi:uncharacterized protein [Lepeophtheirus salmonis]|uniref:uncharacterized protein isoform X1 n=2 Tax=Lepeophtheirus salmonis TaxID=72036 RepID=UPI001AE7B058|nr:uncharacterized protein LOC121125229 isoform X1 [Lepeophtheirus salmonis]
MRMIPPHGRTDYGLGDVIDVIEAKEEEKDELYSSSHPYRGMAAAAANASPALQALITKKKKASYVSVTEEPASKGLRFRYECEGRSAGSIPGVSSTNDKKTYPTIEVVGYKGRAVVVVSCVTSETPYRPHPHNLVGKEGCKKGVCTLEINPESMACSFPSLGIQCVKKKEIEESLNLRQQIRVDPFQTGFAHRDNPQSIDLNSVRLCFQVFLEGSEKGSFTFALKPVVSEPIYDKKARSDLTICRMTEYSAPVTGGKEMLIFCDKVTKDDIQVRFYEEKDGKVIWEGLGDFQLTDVHKQYGICFRTPRYENLEIDRPVKVSMQLRRPSDGTVSESRAFEFLPLDSGRGFWAAKRLKTNYNVFNSILSVDQGLRNQNNGQINMVSHMMKSSIEEESSSLKRKAPLSSENNPCLAESGAPVTSITNMSGSEGQTYRPTSDISMISTINTEPQSVNEILSLAAAEEENEMVLVLDNISVNTTLLQEPDSTENDELSLPGEQTDANHLEDVKYVVVSSSSSPQPPTANMDIDLGLLYDDVMQCVYDDVDVKYDGIDFTRSPPVPPARKKVTSHISNSAAPPVPLVVDNKDGDDTDMKDKPLPETPSKFKSILSAKFPGKKDSPKKKKEIKKLPTSPTNNNNSGNNSNINHNNNDSRQSLFQRLFTRTKSTEKIPDDILHSTSSQDAATTNIAPLLDEEGNEILSIRGRMEDDNNDTDHMLNSAANDDNSNLVSDLDLKDFIDSGNLSQLDNIVTEFANQYLPENEILSLDNAQESNGNFSSGQFPGGISSSSSSHIDNSSFRKENNQISPASKN